LYILSLNIFSFLLEEEEEEVDEEVEEEVEEEEEEGAGKENGVDDDLLLTLISSSLSLIMFSILSISGLELGNEVVDEVVDLLA
jgi:hypothetical protein